MDDLLAEHAEWQYAVQHITSVWETKLEEEAALIDFEKHISRMGALGHDTAIFKDADAGTVILQPLYGASKRKWTKYFLASAAIMVSLISWFLFNKTSSTAINDTANSSNLSNKIIATPSGNRTKMVLPDGTQVWLNAESKLEYNPGYAKTNRDVTLSGEAYFDVVKNVDMPFIINTKKIHIKVTGTAFNVKAYPGEKVSETSLIRGRVEVTVNARPDDKYVLKPNQKLVIRDEEPVAAINKAGMSMAEKKSVNEPLVLLRYLNFVENDSASTETSWVYDRLIFDNESFEAIAIKMERWYGVKIRIEDQGVASQQITYTIKNETIAQALRNMQYAFRFHYTINGNTITITK